MTHSTSTPRLLLKAPKDILAAIPYLLGFHPANSVVVLGLSHKRLIFHARTDLPHSGPDRADLTEVALHLVTLFQAQGADGSICVGYGDPTQVTPLVTAITGVMRSSGLVVFESLRVTGGRYWSYECSDPACCSLDGVPFDLSTSAVAAAATLAGCTALPSREDLVQTLAAPRGDALATAERAAERAERQVAQQTGSLGTARGERPGVTGRRMLMEAAGRYTSGGHLTDDEVAQLAVLLDREPRLRNAALTQVEGGPRQREDWTSLWTDVVRRCHPRLVVAPAVLLAFACWAVGDGVRAGIAVERALAVDGTCPAALVMADLLARAVPPSVLDDLTVAERRAANNWLSRRQTVE